MPPDSRSLNQATLLANLLSILQGYAYGAFTLYGGAFQPTSASPGGCYEEVAQLHIPHALLRGVRFALSPFRSPLLGGSRFGFSSSPY